MVEHGMATISNHTMVTEVLQIQEAKENGIYVKDSTGGLVFTATSQAGAEILYKPACRLTLEVLARNTLHAITAIQRR